MKYLFFLSVLVFLNGCAIGEANRRNFIISHSDLEEVYEDSEEEEYELDL